jgi:formyl-CoA transferase
VAQAVAALSAHGIVVAPVRTLTEAVADPHVAARRMLQDTVLSNGSSAPIVGPPVKFSRTPTRIRHGAPAPGADTAAVLEELGLSGSTREEDGSAADCLPFQHHEN